MGKHERVEEWVVGLPDILTLFYSNIISSVDSVFLTVLASLLFCTSIIRLLVLPVIILSRCQVNGGAMVMFFAVLGLRTTNTKQN